MTRWERIAIVAAATYLVALGWAMQNLRYDYWGALIVVPILVAVSVPLVARAFDGDLRPLRPIVWVGLFGKFIAAVLAYRIRFDAYGGSADAGRYHDIGKLLAGDVRAGLSSPWAVLPSGTGTRFIEELTGLVYTIFGSSRLGGFMVFTWFSFWGLAFFIKAAVVAVPHLAARRYALCLFCFPSLVYWGSSTGKEAFVGLCLGMGSYGAALILRRGERVRAGVVFAALGIVGAAYVRPHFAAVWVGALVIALVARTFREMTQRDERGKRGFRFGPALLVVIAGVGFAVVATITLDYLAPVDDGEAAGTSDRFSGIFAEVEERTGQGGSSFKPIAVNGPQDWPYAAYRTITRPLVIEARSLAEFLPSVEMTALVIVGLFSWRRLLHAPKLMLTTPYLVFAFMCVMTFGVAFSSIGNLGILVRQRSLVLPLVLLFICLPPIPRRPPAYARERVVERKELVGASV